MTDKNIPVAFISHSHSDKSIAEELGKCLAANGVKPWLDKWEIMAGDSLIQKIFDEGLKNCSAFLVLLSKKSVESSWVKHEIDSALVKRLEGTTRLIPIVIEPCQIPLALRALLWIDISVEGIEKTAKKIADVAYGRTERPLVQVPKSTIKLRVSGLSELGASVAGILAKLLPTEQGISGDGIREALNLDAEQINDAIDELNSKGLVSVQQYLGTHPYNFGFVEPTYALALQLRGTSAIDYDPERDIKVVAMAVNALKSATGEMLAKSTELPAWRINNAISYLEEFGVIEVIAGLGTAPYSFFQAEATAATRRFVSRNGK